MIQPSAWCSLISIDGSEASGPEVSDREATATQRTMDTIRSCNVAHIFAACAARRPDSLLALARAVVWAAAAGSGADGDTTAAEVHFATCAGSAVANLSRAPRPLPGPRPPGSIAYDEQSSNSSTSTLNLLQRVPKHYIPLSAHCAVVPGAAAHDDAAQPGPRQPAVAAAARCAGRRHVGRGDNCAR